jgi:hypothetical protein
LFLDSYKGISVSLASLVSYKNARGPVAFTSVATGDWNAAATWTPNTDYPRLAGDTVTIGANDVVTIPAGITITCGAIAMTAGGSGTESKVIINGRLNMAGAWTTNTHTKIGGGPGGVLDLQGNTITAQTGRTTYEFTGTAESRFTIQSTGGRGRFLVTSNPVLISTWDYVTVSGLGDSVFGRGHSAAIVQSYEYCKFTDCGQVALEEANGATNGGILVSHCDFRDPFDATKAYPYISVFGTAGANPRLVEYCTWDQAGAASGIYRTDSSPGVTFDNCVILNFRGGITANTANVVSSNFFFNEKPDVEGVFFTPALGDGFSEFTGNYIYYEDSQHVFIPSNTTQAYEDNVFEQPMAGTSGDGTNWFLYGTTSGKSHTYQNNVWIGNAGNPLCMTGACNFTLLDYSANTYYGGNDGRGDGDPFLNFSKGILTEQLGALSGTVNVYNMLIVCSPEQPLPDELVTLRTSTADQVDLLDYNVAWQPGGATVPPVGYNANVNVTSGEGPNDFAVDPDFVDETRNIATWDASLGGPGTAAHAIAEMLKMNEADYDTDYDPAALVAWVRAGFLPQEASLNASGYGGGNIGAR